jgi:hypothetical protein
VNFHHRKQRVEHEKHGSHWRFVGGIWPGGSGIPGNYLPSHRDVINVGPFKATVNEEKTIPLPPILGILALAGGISLILVSRKSA